MKSVLFKEMDLKYGNVPDSKFDPEQLAIGIKVETEHTDDQEMAKQIAKAHLIEDELYYTHLLEMEKKYN